MTCFDTFARGYARHKSSSVDTIIDLPIVLLRATSKYRIWNLALFVVMAASGAGTEGQDSSSEFSATVIIAFDSPEHAAIAIASMEVDDEVHPERIQRDYSLDGKRMVV